MTTKDTAIIAITLRNGQCFEHHPPKEPPDKELEFLNTIVDGWSKAGRGILMLNYPTALYNMEDVSSIRFPEMVQIPDKTPIGFHPSE